MNQIINIFNKVYNWILIMRFGGNPELRTANLESIDKNISQKLIKMIEKSHYAKNISSYLTAEFQMDDTRYILMTAQIKEIESGIAFKRMNKNLFGIQLMWDYIDCSDKHLNIKDTKYAYDIAVIKGFRNLDIRIFINKMKENNNEIYY